MTRVRHVKSNQNEVCSYLASTNSTGIVRWRFRFPPSVSRLASVPSSIQRTEATSKPSTKRRTIITGRLLPTSKSCFALLVHTILLNNMTDYGGLHYPNLGSCRITLMGAAASSRPPVSLSAECVEVANVPPRNEEYDFSLGKLWLE
jgi:hypothetical protein